MDDRDRDWRRSQAYGRFDEDRGRSYGARRREERTWGGPDDPYDIGPDRPPYDEGEQDYGGRSGLAAGGWAYGARGAYGEGYGRGGGRSPRDSEDRGGDEARMASQDYTGRSYDEERSERRRRGREPGAPEAFERGAARYGGGRERGYGFARERAERRYPEDMRRGVYGGYDDERRYAGREGWRARGPEPRSDVLQRAGERISSWFRGDSREEDRGQPRWYREDWGREARPIPEPGRRGLGPKGYRRSDERINEDVHERLTDDPWLDASNIEVQVKDGEVTLSGHVENREAKHRAERLVEDLSGVGHVQNNLRVRPQGSLTSPGRGYGSSAMEAEMRRDAEAELPPDTDTGE
jgi:hypothetical protein